MHLNAQKCSTCCNFSHHSSHCCGVLQYLSAVHWGLWLDKHVQYMCEETIIIIIDIFILIYFPVEFMYQILQNSSVIKSILI